MAEQSTNGGGVRSLRAMFENHEGSPSADRGRTDTGEQSGANGRPLSKVRSSFVPVESSPARGTAANPVPAGAKIENRDRRNSFDLSVEEDADKLASIHKSISREEKRRSEDFSVEEAVPEDAVETGPAPTPIIGTPKLKAMSDEKNPLSQRRTRGSAVKRAMQLPTPQSSTRERGRMVKTNGSKRPTQSTAASGTKSKPYSTPNGQVRQSDPTMPQNRPNTSGHNAGPADFSQRFSSVSSSTAAPSEKTVAAKGVPNGRALSALRTISTNTSSDAVSTLSGKVLSDKKAFHPGQSSVTKKPSGSGLDKNAGSPTGAEAGKSLRLSTSKSSLRTSIPGAQKTPGSATGPEKHDARTSRVSLSTLSQSSQPRERQSIASNSRTQGANGHANPSSRPAGLSSRLLAPTASSAAKRSPDDIYRTDPNSSLSASRSLKSRSSTASLAGSRASNGLSASSTMRKISAPRISAGAKSSSGAPPTSKETTGSAKRSPAVQAPSEGFLARMMRPTASSQNKVHERHDGTNSASRTQPSRKAAPAKHVLKEVVNGIDPSSHTLPQTGNTAAESGTQPTNTGAVVLPEIPTDATGMALSDALSQPLLPTEGQQD